MLNLTKKEILQALDLADELALVASNNAPSLPTDVLNAVITYNNFRGFPEIPEIPVEPPVQLPPEVPEEIKASIQPLITEIESLKSRIVTLESQVQAILLP